MIKWVDSIFSNIFFIVVVAIISEYLAIFYNMHISIYEFWFSVLITMEWMYSFYIAEYLNDNFIVVQS